MKKILLFVFCIFVLFMCLGCRSLQPTPTNTETRVEYRDRVKIDSVIVRDSIYIRERGDTIFYERWHVSRETLHDTIRVCQIDTIRVPVFVEKEVEVERELTWFESVKMKVGGWALLFVIALIIFYFVKKYLKL